MKEVKFGDDPLFGVGESPQKGYDSKPHPNQGDNPKSDDNP